MGARGKTEAPIREGSSCWIKTESVQIIGGGGTDGTGDVQEVHLVFKMVDKRVCYFQTPSVSWKSVFLPVFQLPDL